jgi:hypothetical protein
MRSRKLHLVMGIVGVIFVLLLFEPSALAHQTSDKSSTLPSAVGSLINALEKVRKFIQCEKNTAKRDLLIKRLNRLSDRVKTLTTNTDNFRESLFDSEFDVERALENVVGVQRNLSDVRQALNTIVSDLNLQDQVPVQEINTLLFNDSQSRGIILRSIQSELSNARSGGKIDLQTIKEDAGRALGIAQKLQRRIAEFLQKLRSNPVDCPD